MRKIAICLITLMIIIFPCYSAVSDEVQLEIKAYKLGGKEEFIELTITDALSGSLNIVEGTSDVSTTNQARLDISDYIEDFLGRLPSAETTSDLYGGILFSYRLDGNLPGNYDIDITLSSFKKDGGSDIVNAYFGLVNENVIFNGTSKTESAGGFSISRVDEANDDEWGVTSGETKASLHTGVSITSPAGAGKTTDDIWIARGAVYSIISSGEYESASNGEYISDVTVTITTS